jgi:hypothetical protein
MEESVLGNKIPCGCGCGTLIEPFDKWHHRPRQYANRHSNKGKKFVKPERFEILCFRCDNKTNLNKIGNPIWYHDNENNYICRSCWDKERYYETLDYQKQRGIKYRNENHDKIISYLQTYYQQNKDRRNKERRDYYYENRQSQIDKMKEH